MATARHFTDEIVFGPDGIALAMDATDTLIPTPTPPIPPTDADVSADSAALVAREREIAQAHGFAHDDRELAFQAGTKLWDVGLDAAQSYAADYAALPSAVEAATKHAAVITAEQRRDRNVVTARCEIDSIGRFKTDTGHTAAISLNAWNQLGAQQLRIPEESKDATPETNAANARARGATRANVNAWLGRVHGQNMARVRTYRGETRSTRSRRRVMPCTTPMQSCGIWRGSCPRRKRKSPTMRQRRGCARG